MGVCRTIAVAALLAASVSGSRAAASTVTEPIARLYLEGGYDSNVLYTGTGGDATQRVSPELGLRLRDHLWDATGTYLGDYVVYSRRAPGGVWNHRGMLKLEATPTRRTTIAVDARGGYAYDPVGLAQMGIVVPNQDTAWMVQARARVGYWAARRTDVAATYFDRTVIFSDGTGGAMHQPGAEALYRVTGRLSLGGAYVLGLFQTFETTGTSFAYSNGLRARLHYRYTRDLYVSAYAGPAMWNGPDGQARVPEFGAEAGLLMRQSAIHANLSHGLGIGSTARPGLVDSLDVGGMHRFGRTYDLGGFGGLWHTGQVPTGANAVWSYGLGADAGMRIGETLRVSIKATNYGRLTGDTSGRRTTVGLGLGWSYEGR